jgi:hypothetical protein
LVGCGVDFDVAFLYSECMSTQKRVIAAIRSQIEDAGAELVNDTQWANTGTLSAVYPAEITSPRRLHYGFQSKYVSFGDMAGYRDPSIGRLPYCEYHKTKVIQDAIDSVVAYLLGRG